VASPQWETGYSKKMKATLSRELHKIRRNLGGIRRMNRLPAAVVAVDQRKEINAIREARALGIPTICLVDTDSDPTLVDIAIPGNDDAMRGIEVIIRELADAVEEGLKGRPEPVETGEARDAAGAPPPRRSRRRVTVESAPEAPAAEAPSAESSAVESIATPGAAGEAPAQAG